MKFSLQILIVILLVGGLFFWRNRHVNRYDSVVGLMNQIKKKSAEDRELMLKSALTQVKLSSFQLKDRLPVMDSSGSIIELAKIVDQKVLVYRISESYCSECNKAQLPYIGTISNRLGPNRVFILGSFLNKESLAMYVRSNQIKVPAYNISAATLSTLPMETLHLPYFFVLDKGGLISSVFIARKEIPSLSEAYCKMISNDLSRN